MTTTKPSFEDFVTRIREEATKLCKEYPNVMYRRSESSKNCFYTIGKHYSGEEPREECVDGREGCIVGLATIRAFPEAEPLLKEVDGQRRTTVACNVLRYVYVNLDQETVVSIQEVMRDPETKKMLDSQDLLWLDTIQNYQDNNHSWGEAYTLASAVHYKINC